VDGTNERNFFRLNLALENHLTHAPLYDPELLSLIVDHRWERIEGSKIRKYEIKNGEIKNKSFARDLFRMIIKYVSKNY